ncbi:MAG: type-F conjugative transfer system secretin TraK [Pseudomonadota bacterium]
MSLLTLSLFATGLALAFRPYAIASRSLGWTMLGAAAVLTASPALADETILAEDNGEVRCTVSAKDLTRISLEGDQFAAVSKVDAGDPTQDFAVVHEPTRGDIYLSVPDGYSKPSVSFFGTSRKGYVYKFACRVGGAEAVQVFVANRAEREPPAPAVDLTQTPSLEVHAVGLVRAMFAGQSVRGYEIADAPRAPVNVGALKVQLLSEYLSPTLTGKVLRVQNIGAVPVTLTEGLIAGEGAIAVSIANANLAPGQMTAVYIVTPSEGI